MRKADYEKLQYKEQEETNYILWVNTIATIVTGVASLIIAMVALWK